MSRQLLWTARQLGAAGLEKFFGGHCTGIEAVYRLREASSLVAAVGSSFELGAGISPGALAPALGTLVLAEL